MDSQETPSEAAPAASGETRQRPDRGPRKDFRGPRKDGPRGRKEAPADDDHGILLIDKPMTWTSHDVVNFVRRRHNLAKVGHCGTLDPLATGLLVLVLGKATRMAEHLAAEDKIYSSTLTLGKATASYDSDGAITEEKPWEQITEAEVRQVFSRYIGELTQMPPMVSAVKVGGKKLYELARKGIEIERASRPIKITSLKIDRVALPEVDFTLHCSKGTYVRTLCHDIGHDLGSCGHMSALRRHRSGIFRLEDAVTVDDIRDNDRDYMRSKMVPLATMLTRLAAAGLLKKD